MNKKIRKKQIAAIFLLAVMACRIFLPGRYAKAALAPHQYSGYDVVPVKNNSDYIYLRGHFSSTSTKKFEAHFFTYVNNTIYDYTHKTCSGRYSYYIYSPECSIFQPSTASGYTTK